MNFWITSNHQSNLNNAPYSYQAFWSIQVIREIAEGADAGLHLVSQGLSLAH